MPVRMSCRVIALAVALLSAGCDSGASDPTQMPMRQTLIDDTIPAGFSGGSAATLAPTDNALTEPRAQLGKRLFFETQLSRTGQVSCGSCHLRDNAFSDPNAVSTGVDQRHGTRNAPALVNLAWGQSFFWDGRAATLEEQAGKPIEHPDEMDLPIPAAVARVGADPSYMRAFVEAYGGPPSDESLRKAIASFVRTLVSGKSPYDRHLRGDDQDFGDQELRGEGIFLSEKGGCFHCHPSGMLTNEGFFNNGTYRDGGDPGRQMVTNRTGDLGKFKVPGLRNVEASAPYMHDGSLATLEDVVEHYDRGGSGHRTTDPSIRVLSLSTDEKADLVTFLRSLTDRSFLADPRWTAGTE
jgi:cytochrome c peroxidase